MDVVRTARSRRLPALTLVVLAGAALVTAACGDDDPGPQSLPTLSSAPPATPDAKAAIEAAYRGYEAATEEMAASGDPNPAKLRPYATAARAQKDAESLAVLFDQNYRIVGETGIDVRSVTVTGDKAVVEACIDTTKWVTVEKGKQPAPDETGPPPGLARVQLVHEGGDWLVSSSEDGGAC